MGGCCSSEERFQLARGSNISGPSDLIMQAPRPRLDYGGRPIRVEDYELDRRTLEAALTYMAQYIENQRQAITVIAVGGVVNTMLLQNRQSTHDVDFFGTNINNRQRILLDEAAKYAERKTSTPLGGEWFNNQTMLWMPPDVQRKVTREALEQNEVVFQKRGLKVLAAPWNYAMCGKINRLVRGDEARPYDLTDAVSYLRCFIQRHGGPIPVARVKRWCQEYQKTTTDDVIRSISREYMRIHGTAGISR